MKSRRKKRTKMSKIFINQGYCVDVDLGACGNGLEQFTEIKTTRYNVGKKMEKIKC